MGARAASQVWPRGGFLRGDRGAVTEQEQGSWEAGSTQHNLLRMHSSSTPNVKA